MTNGDVLPATVAAKVAMRFVPERSNTQPFSGMGNMESGAELPASAFLRHSKADQMRVAVMSKSSIACPLTSFASA